MEGHWREFQERGDKCIHIADSLHFGRAQLSVTLWTVAHQAPLSMGFSRQEYWSGLPFSTPGNLPDPGFEPMSPAFPSLAGRFFTTESHRNPSIKDT